MKYLLKNKSTNEEVLCTKVMIDGFDYYISGTPNKYYEGYYVIDNSLQHTSRVMLQTGCKVVIATNNPSIDISQIVDKVEELSYNWLYDNEENNPKDFPLKPMQYGFEQGYNTHSSTHTLSDDEVVEFNDWCIKNYCCEILFSGKWYKRNGDDETEYTSKELLQLFKEQLPKTIYYNE